MSVDMSDDDWDRELIGVLKSFTEPGNDAYVPETNLIQEGEDIFTPDDVNHMSLVAADFSQIEARCLAWLAGDKEKLDVFARHEDVYVYAAKKIGSDNRQYGKVCELGLGFGMGWEKFIDTAKLLAGLQLGETEAQMIVSAWRATNEPITRLWVDYQSAFRTLVDATPGKSIEAGSVRFERGKDAMGILLPCGKRRLIYRNPRLMEDDTGRKQVVYDGIHQFTKHWGPVKTYGGKLAENITQAMARDVMGYAMLALDRERIDLRLTVHDEIVALALDENAKGVLNTMLRVMRTPPAWAPDLPVWAEGWVSKRYRK